MQYLPNILIVDDLQENLFLLKHIIRRVEANLIQACSGFEALEKIQGIDIALAIIDIEMPVMNGYELTQKINELRYNEKIPVIFLTANYINEKEIFKGYDYGAVDYLYKPINNHILLSKIKVFLDLSKQKQIIIREAAHLKEVAHELTHANIALNKSKERYKNYVDNAPDGVFVTDETGRFVEVNKAACKMTGYPKDELLSMSISDILPIESIEEGLVHFRKLSNHENSKSDFKFKHENGDILWWTIESVILSKTRFLSFAKDITLRMQAIEELQESEELFRSVVNNSIELTTLTDSNGIIFFVGPQCDSVLGHPGSLFIGKQFPNIIHPDDIERYQQVWKKVIHEELELREFEFRIIDESGSIRWLFYTAKQVRVNERLLGIQSTIRNITDHKLAEHAMRISEEKYRTLLNASPDGILLINLNGTITEVSEIGLELFGTSTRDDLVGKDFFQFIPFEETHIIKEIIEKTIFEGLVQNIGLKIRKKSQTIFFSEISATLIQSPDGEPLSFMISIRDISQRKKIETKQIHADRMANLGEMASGIAHEINQPLNIISMVMDKILFESAKTDTIDLEFLKNKSNKIFENIIRIRNIIDHIRAFSRSHDDYILSAFDVNLSIENATSMIKEQFKHLGINLNIELDNQIPQILGNTYKLEQVIINLLINAKDAVIERKNTQEQNYEMNVGIRSFEEKHNLIVEIKDNGIGINNEDINNIILPFYTTKDEGKGTGLGLSICYQIIKEMNGTIDITSVKNIGTKIRLVLEIQMKK
jgi:PAS domain S-box-containing protein